MKKKFMLILLILLLINTNVKALCSDESINKWAENINLKIKVVENEEYPFSYLLLLDDNGKETTRNDIKVIAKDTYSEKEYEVAYDEDFKNYVIGSEIHFVDKTYELKIYMNDKADSCKNELVKTIKYVVPKYNSYNDTLYCEENKDDPSCGAYTKVDKNDKMDEKVKDYYDKQVTKEEYKNKPIFEKILGILLEYAPYVLVPLILLSIVYFIIIKIVKKRSDEK